MQSISQQEYSSAPPEKLFCVFCNCKFWSATMWWKHTEEHVNRPGRGMSPDVRCWVRAFLKSQQQPFLFSSHLPHVIGSYADCNVCLNIRDVGHKVRAVSCRFQKGSHRLENHLRAHLCYKSFFCLICRQSDFQFKNTIVSSAGQEQYFAVVRAPQPGPQLRTNRQAVLKHIRQYHLKQVFSISGQKVVQLNSFIGSTPIPQLESLIQSTVKLHRRNLSAIRAVKNKQKTVTNSESLQELRSKKPQVVEKLSQIRMQPEKSYFNISVETDQLLNDIDEVLAAQNENFGMEVVVAGSPLTSVSSISSIISDDRSDTITLSSTDSDIEILPDSQLSVFALAAPPARTRRSTRRRNIRKRPASVSLLRSPSSSEPSPVMTARSSAAVRGRPVHRMRDARRRLTFDHLPVEGVKAVSFLEAVNPYAPGVVTCEDKSTLDVTDDCIPYSKELDELVDSIIRKYASQTPELQHLSGKAVADILMEISLMAEDEDSGQDSLISEEDVSEQEE